MQRRMFIESVASIVASAYSLVSHASNKYFPTKSIKIIVGSAPGALTDVASRIYSEKITTKFGSHVLVENVAGASSTIAINKFLKSEADGHTLLAVANTVFTYPYLSDKATYKPAKDFLPVAELARGPAMFAINSQLNKKTLNEFIEEAKNKKQKLSYASGGMGTTSHLPMEMFQKDAGIELLHVPYKGVASAVVDVVGGRVDSMMGTPASMLSALKSGQLRALAVTSEERINEFPDVPTFKELGFSNVTYTIFIALVAPSSITPEVREKIASLFNGVKDDKHLLSSLQRLGQNVDIQMNDLNRLDKFLFEDEAKYAKLIKEKNIRVD